MSLNNTNLLEHGTTQHQSNGTCHYTTPVYWNMSLHNTSLLENDTTQQQSTGIWHYTTPIYWNMALHNTNLLEHGVIQHQSTGTLFRSCLLDCYFQSSVEASYLNLFISMLFPESLFDILNWCIHYLFACHFAYCGQQKSMCWLLVCLQFCYFGLQQNICWLLVCLPFAYFCRR